MSWRAQALHYFIQAFLRELLYFTRKVIWDLLLEVVGEWEQHEDEFGVASPLSSQSPPAYKLPPSSGKLLY